ncbi:MAG: hypothetical protein ACRECE_07530, partial [Xanthobacteraceae bacterium]
MLKTATALLSAAIFSVVASTAFAATGSMSKRDMAMMKKCQSMSHTAMMKNKKCMAMMKKHPSMMKNNSMGSNEGHS